MFSFVQLTAQNTNTLHFTTLLRPILAVLVWQWPLVVIVIITAVKEEVRKSSIKKSYQAVVRTVLKLRRPVFVWGILKLLWVRWLIFESLFNSSNSYTLGFHFGIQYLTSVEWEYRTNRSFNSHPLIHCTLSIRYLFIHSVPALWPFTYSFIHCITTVFFGSVSWLEAFPLWSYFYFSGYYNAAECCKHICIVFLYSVTFVSILFLLSKMTSWT